MAGQFHRWWQCFRNAKFIPFFCSRLSHFSGCQIDPAKVADHSLYASQAEVKDGGESLTFAVVGNVRSNVAGLDRRAGRHAHDDVTSAVVQSIAGEIGSNGPICRVYWGHGDARTGRRLATLGRCVVTGFARTHCTWPATKKALNWFECRVSRSWVIMMA